MSKRSEGSDIYLQCVGLTRLISTWKIPWYCSLFYMSIFVLLSFTQYSLHWIIKNNSLRSSQMYYNHNQKIHTVVGNTETNRLEEITETLNPDPAAGLLSMMSLYTLDCYIDQILQCILRFLHNLQPTTLSDRWQYVKKKKKNYAMRAFGVHLLLQINAKFFWLITFIGSILVGVYSRMAPPITTGHKGSPDGLTMKTM